jgi:hypothetical protein
LRRAGFTRIIAPARFKEWAQRRRERAQKDTHKFSMNRPFVLVLLLVLLPGCSSTGTMRRQLERVAKDWSLTVRASQILPVYPLTEDLKPGDVFLVQERIEDQVRVFEARGFLPLDKHVARLSSAGFSNFYESAFGLSGATATVGPPYLWSRPLEETNHWGYAPGAAFPSYSFEFKRGGGLSLALPVQGVPVAMGLLGLDSAYGSITIKDGFTYGLSEDLMLDTVLDWAARNPRILKLYASTNNPPSYLRVVNRVFLAGEVSVFLTKARSGSVAGSAGLGRDTPLFDGSNSNAVQNYSNLLTQLGRLAESSGLPGGSLKIAAATTRSLSLHERFRRPLIIGYLAMEFPLLPDGSLGLPFSTLDALTKKKFKPSPGRVFSYDATDENTGRLMAWLSRKDAAGHYPNQEKLVEWLLRKKFQTQAVREVPLVAAAPEYRELRKQIVEELINRE